MSPDGAANVNDCVRDGVGFLSADVVLENENDGAIDVLLSVPKLNFEDSGFFFSSLFELGTGTAVLSEFSAFGFESFGISVSGGFVTCSIGLDPDGRLVVVFEVVNVDVVVTVVDVAFSGGLMANENPDFASAAVATVFVPSILNENLLRLLELTNGVDVPICVEFSLSKLNPLDSMFGLAATVAVVVVVVALAWLPRLKLKPENDAVVLIWARDLVLFSVSLLNKFSKVGVDADGVKYKVLFSASFLALVRFGVRNETAVWFAAAGLRLGSVNVGFGASFTLNKLFWAPPV